MLGIDVEAIALRIAMGEEESDDESTDIQKHSTEATMKNEELQSSPIHSTMSDSIQIE